ncbi:NAD(P)/FAD-dependent oxidoreductase [Sporolituus thermophilus]|uniref:Sarcosine oxidase subunit beta n=1 Tax=Sporolituus thermophilus DSM 23256 TaxID=1123285 RepID=A0A1G7L663_9FIRM|nr:FAD-dependent oxidoreductase [Sporolituus thermophilus]SDF44968.1 sarcosine oxidase subunit beta [Sporolituus thermophilus DSM 23256]
MTSRANVVVIGGGVIGTACAYYAAKAGHKVTLLERETIAGGTSGACDGFIIMQSKTVGPHLALALESAALYRTLSEELEFDLEYRPCGGMIVIEDEIQAGLMAEVVAKQRTAGLAVEMLPIGEARRREPLLAADLWGATFSPVDAQVNPILVAQGFSQAARRLGAAIHSGVEAAGLIVEQGRVRGVITAKGERLSADVVVNAAGVWAPALVKPYGVDLPITPRRGQILVSEPLPPMLSHVLLCACYLTAKYRPQDLDQRSRHHRLGVGLAVEQAATGGLLLGSTREFVGFDRRTTLEGLAAVASHVTRILPALAGVNIIRSFAGLRPHTPTGLPILGPLPELPGLIMAAGHEGDGIALAPVTGKRVAEYIKASG